MENNIQDMIVTAEGKLAQLQALPPTEDSKILICDLELELKFIKLKAKQLKLV